MLTIVISVICNGILSGQTTTVLWLGNSYTASNNLPDLLYQLALSGGDTIQFDSNTPGGYRLEDHWNSLTSQSKITQQPWDYVILQAQSQEPSLDSTFVANWVLPYADALDSVIHLNDSCTQTVFYMTWGRKNGDASNCVAYPPVCTYQGMQDQLRNRYLQMGYDNNAVVAPCGETWRDVIATNPTFDLYVSDESHPSLYGSYLNACVFYATMYRRSPVGLSYYGGLPMTDAIFLQQVAASTVLDSMSVWNTEVYYDDPSFTNALVSGTTYSFSASTTGTNHEWNFGQGFVSGTANENYTFPGNGTYTIVHVTDNGCHTDTSFETVVVGPQSVEGTTLMQFEVYPNPVNEIIRVSVPLFGEGKCELEIVEVTGRVVIACTITAALTEINTASLSPGSYIIRLTHETTTVVRQFSVLRN